MKSRQLFFFLFVTFLIQGCTHSKEKNANVFCYNESNGITTLDPAFARDLEIMWATNQLFDGLVELDSNLNVQPSIAESWTISDEGKTYTFYLRKNVYFHPSPLFKDSTHRKVIAQDFVYSFNRILDPKVASPGQWIFAQISSDPTIRFQAPNDSVFIIQLKEAFTPFLGMLTTQYCNVVPEEVVAHYGSDFRNHPIGTGPFRFAFWYENVTMVFHRFDRYWQKDNFGNQLPYLDAIKIDFARDMSVEFQGLLQGRYDFMSGIHTAFKDELLDPQGNLSTAYGNDIYFQKKPFIKTDFIGFVVDPKAAISAASPYRNVRVREAIKYAINRNEMVEYLRNNSVFPANNSFIPPTLRIGHEADSGNYYDIEKARKLLQEAGYPDGKGLPELILSTTGDYTDLMEYIQHELQRIGIPAQVQVMQSSSFREATAKNQLIAFRKSWLADYADPENFLSVFYSKNFSPSGPNYTHFSNPEFDLIYEQAVQEMNDSIRNSLYEKMNDIITKELPVIPLYYDQVSHFIRKGISGLTTNSVNMIDLKTVKKTH